MLSEGNKQALPLGDNTDWGELCRGKKTACRCPPGPSAASAGKLPSPLYTQLPRDQEGCALMSQAARGFAGIRGLAHGGCRLMVTCLSEERQAPQGKKRGHSPDGSLERPGQRDPGASGLDRDTLPSLLKA